MVTAEAVTDRQVAVLIDFENVGLSSIQWLFDQISDIGRITVRRAYADWSVARSKRDQLLELGIEPIHLFHAAGSGKNSSDIRLAIDAVDLLYLSPVDTFVVVSSDTDFVPLVSKLRAAGKTVIGAGRQATASPTLVRSCDRYLYLDQGDRPRTATPPSQDPEGDTLLVRAVKAGMDDQGRVVGSRLHETMQRLDPSFDFRALGYSNFTKFLEASPDVKVARPRGVKGRSDVIIELAEADLAEAGPTGGFEELAPKIDAAWSNRAASPGRTIPGAVAATDAALVLGTQKLSVSEFKTLQRLLDASEKLSAKWSRDGNKIVRR